MAVWSPWALLMQFTRSLPPLPKNRASWLFPHATHSRLTVCRHTVNRTRLSTPAFPAPPRREHFIGVGPDQVLLEWPAGTDRCGVPGPGVLAHDRPRRRGDGVAHGCALPCPAPAPTGRIVTIVSDDRPALRHRRPSPLRVGGAIPAPDEAACDRSAASPTLLRRCCRATAPRRPRLAPDSMVGVSVSAPCHGRDPRPAPAARLPALWRVLGCHPCSARLPSPGRRPRVGAP